MRLVLGLVFVVLGVIAFKLLQLFISGSILVIINLLLVLVILRGFYLVFSYLLSVFSNI